MKKLNAFQIKILLIILMLLDHIWFAFPTILPVWIHAITRGVAPMFGYFLVEGFNKTSNKLKYGSRLFLWAIFMQIGNTIINNLFITKKVTVTNNIFFTLFISFIILLILDNIKKLKGLKKGLIIFINIFIIIFGILFTEGGFSVVPFVIITYYLKNNNKKLILGYCILSSLLFLQSFQLYETFSETFNMLMFNSDFLLILAIPFILIYNGKRGVNNKFSKYLFYVFYPLHLWILALIEFLVK